MPTDQPTFKSLTSQVTARMVAEIEAGTWVGWLPGERALTEALRVSRKTVRKAIEQLKHDGQLETLSGRGHRIVTQARPRRSGPNSVGLLTPDPLENLRPYTALWVDELRALLFETGTSLALFS